MMELLYGRNPVLESLRAGRRRPQRLLVAAGSREQGVLAEIVKAAAKAGVPVRRLDKQELAAQVGHGHHQGVALETGDYPYVSLDELLAADRQGEAPFFLVLDLLQDPQNVGTLLRTAEAVGVTGVIVQERRAVGVTPAVVNASSGAAEHLKVALEVNLARALDTLKEHDVWVYGLAGEAEATVYSEVKLDGPAALVVGSEGAGMRRLVRERCDLLIRLPMRGRVESLNAAVAGSVALYAVWRARGFAAPR